MVLICISMMINGVEHLFLYLLAICMSSLEKCLIPLSIFKLAFVLLMSCMHFVYILDANYLLDKYFANIFYHSTGVLFILLMVSFAVQKPFSFM